MADLFTNLIIATSIYVVGVASPGPSNLAIAHHSIMSGRKSGLSFACGVIVGSFFWGLVVASGLAPLLESYSWLLSLLKLAGGLYFIYLAYKSFRAAYDRFVPYQFNQNNDIRHSGSLFLSGILFHLLNPKVLLVWTAIIAAALPTDSANMSLYIPVAVCLPFGVLVFSAYAIIFSNSAIVDFCLRYKRRIDAVVPLG